MSDKAPNQIPVSQTPNPWGNAHEYVAIVRELAERGPFNEEDGWCAFCHKTFYPQPQHHDPPCLWRRAKALYPD